MVRIRFSALSLLLGDLQLATYVATVHCKLLKSQSCLVKSYCTGYFIEKIL